MRMNVNTRFAFPENFFARALECALPLCVAPSLHKEKSMSGHGFHVHGPHDHEVEHVAQHGGDSFTSRLAVLTAILSTVGAIFGYMGGHSQNAALLYKNEAAIQKTSASNQWNYYQAKSNKQNLAELSITLTSGEAQEKYRK